MFKTMISQINTLKLFLLCLFILFSKSSDAQTSTFRYLDMNTILKDNKIQLAKNQLFKGWAMRANGSNFYIERQGDVFLPQSALKSMENNTNIVFKNVHGKKILMMKTKAYFLMTIEKKLPNEKVELIRTTCKAIYQTDYYTVFLWQEHGFTYSNKTIPSNLNEEFRAIEKLLGSLWK
jgi:Neuraminidase (sialidase)